MFSIKSILSPKVLIVVVLMSATLLTRLEVVDDRSISQDESTMILFAMGVLEKGFPNIVQHTGVFIISTYELVPFPIAASLYFLGKSEFSVRLPAMLFACFTTLLIVIMGSRFHSFRAGVLAASFFVVMPWAIYWGTNAFYPSQLQFITTITLLILHGILKHGERKPWSYYAVAFSIIMMYISWEGSGFLLPVFFIVAIVLTWGRWKWLATPHAWVAAFTIISIVIAQLAFRTVLRAPYTGLGTSRSDVTFLEPAFTAYSFDPTFYFSQLLTPDNLFIMSLFLVGIFVLRKQWSANYLTIIVCLAVTMLTSMLGYYALRYVYFLLPAILVISAMTLITMTRPLIKLYSSTALTRRQFSTLLYVFILASGVFFTSPWGIKFTQTASNEMVPFEVNYASNGFSFRPVAEQLNAHYEQGDTLVVQAPFPFMYYTGLTGDFFLQQGTATTVFYHPQSMPYYLDKWIQNPVIQDIHGLKEMLHSRKRVWFIFAPLGASTSGLSTEMRNYIETHAITVSEAADGKLLLWRNPYFKHEG